VSRGAQRQRVAALHAGATRIRGLIQTASDCRGHGFPEAIEAIFPQTTVQTCIVHLIRHSLKYVPRRQYDKVVKDLRPIYTAIDADAALLALEEFDEKWGEKLGVITQACQHQHGEQTSQRREAVRPAELTQLRVAPSRARFSTGVLV